MRRAVQRPLVACGLLLVLYVALSLCNDPRGFLGTDTGGKVATMRVMAQRATVDPNVGYWAERWDPEGRLHPLYYTSHLAGKWVNVTTLPALLVGLPLYAIGGYRLALLVPMAGSLAAALGARALARRLGGDERAGWRAFWLTGAASPLLVYALDFWEHSLGVAFLAWAAVAAVDLLDEPGASRAAVFGVLVGVAATMRTEAFVFGAAMALAVGVSQVLRRVPLARLALVGAVAAVALAAPLVLNDALERAVIGASLRANRATGTAIAAGSNLPNRLSEASTTTFGLGAGSTAESSIGGAVLCGLVVLATRRRWSSDGLPLGVIGLVGVVTVVVARFTAGLGFIPGLLTASPLAVVGIACGLRGRGIQLGWAVLAALPVVWWSQFEGGAGPQWGGRYVLFTGFVLVVLAALALDRFWRPAAAVLVATAVAVTGFGEAWLSVRSHAVAHAVRTIDDRPEPVVVSAVAHLAREGGATYGDRRWLTALSPADLARAGRVVEQAGFARFLLVQLRPERGTYRAPRLRGFTPRQVADVEFLPGVPLVLVRYDATAVGPT